MCREVGHDAIAVRVLADKYLQNINRDKARLGSKIHLRANTSLLIQELFYMRDTAARTRNTTARELNTVFRSFFRWGDRRRAQITHYELERVMHVTPTVSNYLSSSNTAKWENVMLHEVLPAAERLTPKEVCTQHTRMSHLRFLPPLAEARSNM